MSWLDAISSGLTAGTQGASGYLQGQQRGRKEEDERAMRAAAMLRQKHIDEQNALMAQAQIGNFKSMAEDRLRTKPAEPFTLGQGQVRFGPDGKQIAQGAPEDPKNPIIGSPAWREAMRFQSGLIPRDDKTLVAVVGPDGKGPVLVNRSQAAGMVPWEKASGGGGGSLGVGNAVQTKSQGFARRMIASDKTLRELENSGKPTAGVQFLKKVPMVGDLAGKAASSEDQQRYDTARQEFGSAQLRQESGAAINEGEWKQVYERYIRVLGDKNANIEQKRTARILATKMMVKAAGKAWGPDDKAAFDEYLASVEGVPKLSGADLQSAQKDWDAAVKIHGEAKVLQEFGPRPEEE